MHGWLLDPAQALQLWKENGEQKISTACVVTNRVIGYVSYRKLHAEYIISGSLLTKIS